MDNRSDYYDERTCCNSYADMRDNLMKKLEYTSAAKNDFSESAKYELRKLHEKYGGNNTYDEYVKLLQNWK